MPDLDLDELERLHKRWLYCEFSEDPVCREMEEALADGLPALIASARRLAEVEARRCDNCGCGVEWPANVECTEEGHGVNRRDYSCADWRAR